MAYYSLWILGAVLTALSIIFLYKTVTAMKDTFAFQKQFRKIHPESTLEVFSKGWILVDIVLAFLMFSFAAQAQTLSDQWQTDPDRLCFLGIGIFAAAKAIQAWKDGRMMFYRQGLVYQDKDIPYASITSLEMAGRQAELKTKKETLLISQVQKNAIDENMKTWKELRRSGGRKKAKVQEALSKNEE